MFYFPKGKGTIFWGIDINKARIFENESEIKNLLNECSMNYSHHGSNNYDPIEIIERYI